MFRKNAGFHRPLGSLSFLQLQNAVPHWLDYSNHLVCNAFITGRTQDAEHFEQQLQTMFLFSFPSAARSNTTLCAGVAHDDTADAAADRCECVFSITMEGQPPLFSSRCCVPGPHGTFPPRITSKATIHFMKSQHDVQQQSRGSQRKYTPSQESGSRSGAERLITLHTFLQENSAGLGLIDHQATRTPSSRCALLDA